MHRAATCLAYLLIASPALAGGLEFDGVGARAIGRAGATTVSDDGAACLAHNPAGLARRSVTRVQLGMGVYDRDIEYRPPDAVPVETRGSPVSVPLLGGVIGWDRLVIGISYLESGDYAAVTDAPLDALYQNPMTLDRVSERFPHRYGGTSLRVERRTVAAGAAFRATPWLAVGASVTGSRVDASETKYVWAGFSGVFQDFPPTRDLHLAAAGTDELVLGAHAGALIVLESVPLELAVAVSYSADADVSGDAILRSPQAEPFPMPFDAVSDAGLTIPYPLVVRTGARYVGERFSLEVDADIAAYSGDTTPSWSLDLSVQDQPSLPETAFREATSAIHLRDHWSVRGATDVQVVRDFLWLTAGYAFRSRATQLTHMTATFTELASHTVAVGAEAYWRDLTVTIGFARTLSRTAGITSDRILDNPVQGDSRTIGDGRYDRSADAFAVSLEIAWDELLADDDME